MNRFTGPLPLDKRQHALRTFQVFSNRFAGSLPGSISSMRLLRDISGRMNTLVGTLPEFGLKHSTMLIWLAICYNRFSQTLPEEGLRGMT
eukprot:724914-Amphidinium_carterae.1